MRTYDATVAYDVSCYGHIDIEAETVEQAIEIVDQLKDEALLQPEWDTSHSARLVDMYDVTDGAQKDEMVAEDVRLGGHYFAVHLTPDQERLLDAAPQLSEMLSALLAWERHMGGWDGPVWDEAKKLWASLQEPTVPAHEAAAAPVETGEVAYRYGPSEIN